MTTSLWIWSAYHIVTVTMSLFSKEKSTIGFALTAISWMIWSAMLWSGSTGWFLWTNAPIICFIVLVGFAQLGKPPTADSEEKAASIIWGGTLRLFTVLACWALA